MANTKAFILPMAALAAFTRAQSYPSECVSVCQPLDVLISQCDAQNTTSDPDGDDEDTNDSAATRCICSAASAPNEVPACEACLNVYGGNGDNEIDVDKILTACDFRSTSYPGGTQTTSSVTAASTMAAITSAPSFSGSCTDLVTYTSAWNTDDNDNDDDGDSTTTTFISTDFAACGATSLAAPITSASRTSAATFDISDEDDTGNTPANSSRNGATTQIFIAQTTTSQTVASQTANTAIGQTTPVLNIAVAFMLGALGLFELD
ncbi:hypothetical protein LTR53_009166 [Teratosphaeriaceae sp. CCFEE 6253]|nr:hypothetical protein LTR53_009166 [Teratosphaeriaceae sp. CCFEE 6253]